MSEPQANTLSPQDPAPKHFHRALRPHAFRPHSVDPVSTATRRPLFTPAKVAAFLAITLCVLYGTGSLPQVDRFFDRVQDFSHTDSVVGSVTSWLPIMLVGASVLVLATLAFVTLQSRNRAAVPVTAAGESPRKATLAGRLKASLSSRHIAVAPLAEMLAPAAQAAAVPVLAPASPEQSLSPAVIIRREEASEKHREEHPEAHTVARAEPAASVTPAEPGSPQKVIITPVPLRKHLSDSFPTLPAIHPKRRPFPRRPLPPAVAATLQAEANAALPLS